MSAPTGIAVSHDSSAFSDVVESKDTRFLKISIRNESLVPDESVPASGTFDQDLDKLADILEDNVPAYILVRLDDPPQSDKMLYAATRNTLTKSLGSAHFTDNLFATSKADLSAEAYARHKRHLAAPKPMSAREKEMEEVKAAEREAGGRLLDGSQARKNHIGTRVGLGWAEDVENAVKELGSEDGSRLVITAIDPASETLVLSSVAEIGVEGLATALPADEPSYAFFAWPHNITSSPRRDIVFIYSCPSSSPVKHRMLYSSACLSVFRFAQELLASVGGSALASRRIETSDPKELNESFLSSGLGLSSSATAGNVTGSSAEDTEKKAFARPKGPARRH
ncbi:Twinfilin-1 [Grifola frondosa]|uniref:Twinfilin-1 n=1 Tax=Grifola frondosa TaxID=5627 RepID=A0A1C7LX10_GRIFR|nr:Twinfilin-1 [Grifola frondosa]